MTRHVKIFSWAGIFLTLLIFQGAALAIEQNGCTTTYTNGSVNWQTGLVQAIGKASPFENPLDTPPDAILIRAKLDARQNLTHILMKIAFSKSKRGDFLPEDPIIAGVERRAMDATLTHQRYTSDRAMEVTIATNMFGGFLQLVLPEEIGEVSGLKIISPGKVPQDKPLLAPYTGLIVDARKIDFQPTISPIIVSDKGDEIYGPRFISREYAVQAGVCEYTCAKGPIKKAPGPIQQDAIQQSPIHPSALQNGRAGPNPLVIRALRRGGKTNRSIVISRSDALAVERRPERHNFMRKCRVVIVISQ